MGTDTEIFQERELDVFQEMGNIGAGSAFTILSHLLEEPIEGRLIKVMNLDCGRLIDFLGRPEESAMGILFPFSGDISGMLFVVYKDDFVARLTQKVICTDTGIAELDENQLAVVQETTSIMASSYFTAISAYTKMHISIALPALSVDMVGSMVTDSASWIDQMGKNAVCVVSSFSSRTSKEDNYIVLLLQETSADDFLMALEVDV